MQELPHHYQAVAEGGVAGDVNLSAIQLDPIISAPPSEFGGPGNLWSPETLLVAAIADCFLLSFRAIARASKFDFLSLRCEVEGALERKEGVTQFTQFHIHAKLTVPANTDADRANRLLEKVEKSCLISNSVMGTKHLNAKVVIE